jgi:twitching motility protein PilT
MIGMNDFFDFVKGKEGSDLHLCAGRRPYIRVYGELVDTEFPILTPDNIENLIKQIMTDDQAKRLAENKELDISYMLPNVARFRINIYKQRGSYAVAIRVIPYVVGNFNELEIPEIFRKLISSGFGLILIAGPAGSGKTTTIASAIDYINSARKTNIVTVEDPIEFLHKSKKSVVNQREIGTDALSYSSAMQYILRQDVDVCLIGEIRNQDTAQAALSLSESGVLVMSTLHASGISEAINRVINFFPPETQDAARNQMSLVLKAIIAQQLIPRKDNKKGRILACEIMNVNISIRNIIKNGNIKQISSIVQTGRAEGMQTMDQALFELYSRGKISKYELISRAQHPEQIEKQLDRADIKNN